MILAFQKTLTFEIVQWVTRWLVPRKYEYRVPMIKFLQAYTVSGLEKILLQALVQSETCFS